MFQGPYLAPLTLRRQSATRSDRVCRHFWGIGEGMPRHIAVKHTVPVPASGGDSHGKAGVAEVAAYNS